NYNFVNMTLGRVYSSTLVNTSIVSLRCQLPEGTLLSRLEPDKFIIIFPDKLQSAQIEDYKRWFGDIFLDPCSVQGMEDHLFLGNAGMVVEHVTKERIMPILLNATIALYNAGEKGN